jgi:hypothetical protein
MESFFQNPVVAGTSFPMGKAWEKAVHSPLFRYIQDSRAQNLPPQKLKFGKAPFISSLSVM